eukprot:XP_016659343.1 PREDICTED: uncharacterized protein LOC107883589 [Acyrthosiphon pisum]
MANCVNESPKNWKKNAPDEIESFLVNVSAAVLYRLRRKQSSPDDKTLKNSSHLREHIHDTSYDGITMSSENGQSASSIAGNVKPKMEHLINNLDDMLLKQARPAGQDEYVRPSVIVWNPAAMRRQATFAQDAGAANRNAGTYFRPV